MAVNFMNPEIWKSWERHGKHEFLKICKLTLKDASAAESEKKCLELSKCIYDLMWHGIKGQVRKESTVTMLADLVSLHLDISSIVLDIFIIIDNETSCAETSTEDRQRFCAIVKESEKFFTERLLKERLEIDMLQDLGILKTKSFYTKFIKVKTKLYYKQRKFNLYREESEGFSKLVNELASCDNAASNTVEIVKSLIGCFNLDPNRVLDVMLECFECIPDNEPFYISLLKSYMPDPKILCEVLAFKFCFYQNNSEEHTPESLYHVTALMLQHGIVLLEDVYDWLTPDDKSISKEWNKEMSEAKEYVKRMTIVSTKEKEKEENPEESDNIKEKYCWNQKFGLCEALINVGDWAHAEELVSMLPDRYLLDQPPIARALCQLLHSIIEPIYRRYSIVPISVLGRPAPPIKSSLALKPVVNFNEFKEVAIPMLLALGPSLHCDPILMHKVLRLMFVALTSQNDENGKPVKNPKDGELYYDIYTLLDQVILPSLSFMDCNCCIAEEVWTIMKLYPYYMRYCLYGRWKNETYQGNHKLMQKHADAQKKIKGIMKRVSKENVKPVGRSLGKMSHATPGYLFEYMLLQIQIYDNLIVPVVDSLKFLTSLSYDVLSFCLVEALACVDRDKTKHDGMSISLWLQSLASFSGAIYKKYNLELAGLLQYVANQLKAQESLDLLILKEIVHKMAGIEAAEEMTSEMLEAMAGGDILKSEAGYFSQVRNTKKASQRLKETLTENDLAWSLCLLMAQQRDCVVYKEMEKTHLKLVGKLYDQCQDALVQFGTFLSTSMTLEEYISKIPSIQSLLSEYHITADVAFFLARPVFSHTINMRLDALRKSDSNWKKLPPAEKHKKYCEISKEVMDPIVASVRPTYGLKIWEDISPEFFVTFWSLTMYDLHVPVESYTKEVNKVKQLSMQLADSKDITAGKTKKEQERYILLMDKLQDERKKQEEHIERVRARLIQEKDNWFLLRSAKSAKNETITQFLQLCLFPRCKFTAVDALYCAKFVHTIHSLKTANFSTLLCYDRLFCDITYSVTSCTENEANRYGRFLCSMLETVMSWHSDKNIFEKECANYPGFVTKFRVSNHFSEANDHVGFENYRHVCHKWHYKITKAMVVCLDSKDYVQIRNALIILIKILPHFPVLAKLSQIIEKKIEKVKEEEKEKRQDLFILASSYIGQLKTRTTTMIRETDFHIADKVSKSAEKQADANMTSSQAVLKQANGEIKSERSTVKDIGIKESSGTKEAATAKEALVRDSKDKRNIKHEDASSKSSASVASSQISSKERTEKERSKEKEYDTKEKILKKDERREESAEKEKRSRERKEEKLAHKEERQSQKEERLALREAHREERLAQREERQAQERVQREERVYREDRYDVSSTGLKEDSRYASNSMERYYGGGAERSHYYSRDASHEERDMSSLSNSSSGSLHRHSQEPPEVDRADVKRRKLDAGSSSKEMTPPSQNGEKRRDLIVRHSKTVLRIRLKRPLSSKHEERKQQQLLEAITVASSSEKIEKKANRLKSKDKGARDRGLTDEEKELRKERKLGRKRDRAAEEALLVAEQKRRKEEEKANKLASHQNGDPVDSHVTLAREKHHYREKSPQYSRERSHDREGRDKHRREGKRR